MAIEHVRYGESVEQKTEQYSSLDSIGNSSMHNFSVQATSTVLFAKNEKLSLFIYDGVILSF